MIRKNINTESLTAKMIGALFLGAIFAYGIGNSLLSDAVTSRGGGMLVGIGALLMACNSLFVITIGVLFYPILKRSSEVIANGYLSSRIIEATLLIIGVIWLLLGADANISSQLAIKGNFYAYQFAMLVLAAGSIPFTLTLFKTKMIPPFLAMWGIVGYSSLLLGVVLEFIGIKTGLTFVIAGGLFEMLLALWLILKGFTLPRQEIQVQ